MARYTFDTTQYQEDAMATMGENLNDEVNNYLARVVRQAERESAETFLSELHKRPTQTVGNRSSPH